MAEEKCDYPRDFKKHLMELTTQWKNMLKRNKKLLLKCPNYTKCEYKCSSIGGMQYHYPRCAGACPAFKCDLCGREYESRTGLNYHTSTHHTGAERDSNTTPEFAPPTKGRGRPRIHKEVEFVKMASPVLENSILLDSSSSSSSSSSGCNSSKRKGRKAGRLPVNKPPIDGISSFEGETITLGGVAKSPEGTKKQITITIPSIEYPEEYRSYLPIWRDELKNNQLVCCPNYYHCQFQCTTVNGMKYHFIRCQKDKLPEFQCSLCSRSFHCRSGLVWHLKNTHKLSDLPTNQKTIQIQMPNEESGDWRKNKKGRKKKSPPSSSPLPAAVEKKIHKNSRKNSFPKRTVESILKKLIPPKTTTIPSSAWSGSPSATPVLHPPPTRVHVTPTEYSVTDQVPTENMEYGSLVVDYPEEILTQWHKWYSDTSSEEEDDDSESMDDNDINALYNIDDDDTTTIIQYVSEQSSPSSANSSSDEDYNERDEYVRSRGRGRGRGRGRKRVKDVDRMTGPRAPPPLMSDVPTVEESSVFKPLPVTPVKQLPVKQVTPVKPFPVTPVKQLPVKQVTPVKPFPVKPATPVKPLPVKPVTPAKTLPVKPGTPVKPGLPVKPATPVKPLPIKPGTPVRPLPVKPVNSTVVKPAAPRPPKLIKSKPTSHSVIGGDNQYIQLYQLQAPSLVPVQLIGGTHYQLSAANGGSVVLLQQSSSTGTSNSSPQRVSVIMSPHQVIMTTAATPTTTSLLGGHIAQLDGHIPQLDGHIPQLDGYIPQLDGHIPQLDGPSKRGRKRKSLDREFEETRNQTNNETEAGSSRGQSSKPSKKRKLDHNEKEISTPTRSTFNCTKCTSVFSSQSTLRTHNETTHLSVSPEATIAERSPLWRRVIKKYKYVHCDRCIEYKAKSVAAIIYHYERCSRTDTQTYTCVECDKVYTSKQGLDYHLKVFHSTDSMEPEVQENTSVDDIIIDTQTPRAAASKAVSKLQKLSNTQNENSHNDDTVDITKLAAAEDDKFNMKLLRQAFKDNKENVECPKGCGQTYRSFLGLKYHLEHAHILKKTLYKCPFCKYSVTSKKRMSSHLQKKHNKMVDNEDDLEYVTVESCEEDNDDDDEGVDEQDILKEEKEESKARKDKSTQNKTRNFGNMNYKKMVEKMRKKISSRISEELYLEWRPSIERYTLVSESELANYLPVNKQSMKYCHNTQKEHLSQLHLFESRSEERLIYVGGPVWSMDWLPCQNQDSKRKYVAMATYRTFNELLHTQTHEIGNMLTHKGLIQLWAFENLSNSYHSVPEGIMCFGLAHEWGCIREMKWCNGVVRAEEDTPSSDSSCLSRLGILAVACSDGTVKILSIPDPDDLRKLLSHNLGASSPFVVSMNQVSAILKPGSLMCPAAEFGQSLCLQWSLHSDKIAAGFSSGTIAIWNLKSPLSFLQCSDPMNPLGPVLYPIIQLSGHDGPVRCIAWSSCDTNYIFSGGMDRKGLLWDLQQPQVPVQKLERNGVIVKAVWPLVWPSIVFVEETSGAKQCVQVLTFSSAGPTCASLIKTEVPISSLDYSEEVDKIILGDFMGCVTCVTLSPSVYNPLTKCRFQPVKRMLLSTFEPIEGECKRVVYGTNNLSELINTHHVVFSTGTNIKEEEYQSDLIPLTAVTQCLWCPSSHLWGICAFNNGFVRLVRAQKSHNT